MGSVKNGTTDVTRYYVLRDGTTHAPKADITVTDLDLYYVEDLTAISAKADASALGAANSAHADNSAFNVGQGVYRVDWPDAAFDGGIGKKVQLIVVCTGVDTTFEEVELSPAVDVQAWLGSTAPANTGDAFAVVNHGTSGNVGIYAQAVANGVGIAAVDAVTDKLDTALENDGGVYRYTTNALEQAPTGGGVAVTLQAGAIDAASLANDAVTLLQSASNVTSVNDIAVTGPDDFKADLTTLADVGDITDAFKALAEFKAILSGAQGKVTKSGDAYTFFDTDNTTALFTLTYTTTQRTRS